MKERPILMSGPMVRATLEGTKTQTRRVMVPQPAAGVRHEQIIVGEPSPSGYTDGHGRPLRCPYGRPGDQLWVRETWAEDGRGYTYRATNETWPHHWAPSIFMPRAACRLFLEIINIKVERIRDIIGADVLAEGVSFPDGTGITASEINARWEPFRRLWNDLNAKRGYSWEDNPWVWVITYKRIDR